MTMQPQPRRPDTPRGPWIATLLPAALALCLAAAMLAPAMARADSNNNDLPQALTEGLTALHAGAYGQAYKLFKQAAGQDNGEAYYWLGHMRELGLGTPKDLAGAIKAYRTAAADGWSTAAARLGHFYLVGKGVTQNFDEARNWLQMAAYDNNGQAEFDLGKLYENGWGVHRRLPLAYVWYEMAARAKVDGAVKARQRVLKMLKPDRVAEAQQLLKETLPLVLHQES